MTISISQNAYWELFEEIDETRRNFDPSDELDVTWKYPQHLGQGYFRSIQLREGLELAIANYQLHDDLITEASDREHPIEYTFHLSGRSREIAPSIDAEQCASAGQYGFWGSGMAPGDTSEESTVEPISWVSIHMEPELFRSFIGNPFGQLTPELQQLIRNPDQAYYNRSGMTSPTMQGVLQQILRCPYQGVVKSTYLQSKVWELLALLIESTIEAQQEPPRLWKLKPGDIERIHDAKEILLRHLDSPPSLMELARQVGLNDYKLKGGFRQVFGTTAFGYLHNHRLEQAQQLLEAGDMKIAEVARAVGFADRSYFAAAFRKKFGLNPKEYLMRRKYFI